MEMKWKTLSAHVLFKRGVALPISVNIKAWITCLEDVSDLIIMFYVCYYAIYSNEWDVIANEAALYFIITVLHLLATFTRDE